MNDATFTPSSNDHRRAAVRPSAGWRWVRASWLIGVAALALGACAGAADEASDELMLGEQEQALVAERAAVSAVPASRGESTESAPALRSEALDDVTAFDDQIFDAEIEAMRERGERECGPIDVVVANAGGSLTRPHLALEDIPEEGWRASLEANLTSTFLTLKSVLPSMKRRRTGAVITMSSAAARRAHPMSPFPYAAAKAGIQLLTQEVAAQVGPFGIRVNCIAPETILTEENRRQIPDERKAAMAEAHPIQRLGTPEDVARAALFLASDEAGWISGVILDVAGGAVLV